MYTCTCNGDTDTQHVCMNVLHHKHKHTHKAHMHKKKHTFVTHSYTVHYEEKAEEEEYLDTYKKYKD